MCLGSEAIFLELNGPVAPAEKKQHFSIKYFFGGKLPERQTQDRHRGSAKTISQGDLGGDG